MGTAPCLSVSFLGPGAFRGGAAWQWPLAGGRRYPCSQASPGGQPAVTHQVSSLLGTGEFPETSDPETESSGPPPPPRPAPSSLPISLPCPQLRSQFSETQQLLSASARPGSSAPDAPTWETSTGQSDGPRRGSWGQREDLGPGLARAARGDRRSPGIPGSTGSWVSVPKGKSTSLFGT